MAEYRITVDVPEPKVDSASLQRWREDLMDALTSAADDFAPAGISASGGPAEDADAMTLELLQDLLNGRSAAYVVRQLGRISYWASVEDAPFTFDVIHALNEATSNDDFDGAVATLTEMALKRLAPKHTAWEDVKAGRAHA